MNKLKALKSENIFYQKRELLSLLQNGSKGTSIKNLLDSAWNSCITKAEKELFHVICFSMGDIDRSHNIHKTTVDKGGEGNNEQWLEYLSWLIDNQPKQFIKFLPLIPEYVGLRELVSYQIRTKKKKKSITGTWGLLKQIQDNKTCYKALLKLLKNYFNSKNPFQKQLVAKFLHLPRFSKRSGGRDLQEQTIAKMHCYNKLMIDFCELVELEYKEYPGHTNFTGFKKWRKSLNENFEFVLFSNQSINKFDQEQFINWLDQLPSGGRDRTKRRLFDHEGIARERYTKLAKWYKIWEEFKKEKQAEVRVLEEKERTEGLNAEEKIVLAKTKKKAKVNIGADKLINHLENFLGGKNDSITVQGILDNVKFEVPVLLATDCSGSMGKNYYGNPIKNNSSITPVQINRLLTTLILLKNPDLYTQAFIRFGTSGTVISHGSTGTISQNRFMKGQDIKVPNLIDKTKDFYWNFKNVSPLVTTNEGGTNISNIAIALKTWVDSSQNEIEKNHRIEQIQQYSVILCTSDNEFNNRNTAGSSLRDLQMKLKQWFNAEPVILLWDLALSSKSSAFDNMENVIHYAGWNMNIINQIFTKISDLDIIDIYTQLKSLYASTRYDLVKKNLI